MTEGANGLGVPPACPLSDEPTLDQLLAEPIVQQLMRRDSIDEATIRQLLQKTAAARQVSWAECPLPKPTSALGRCAMTASGHDRSAKVAATNDRSEANSRPCCQPAR